MIDLNFSLIVEVARHCCESFDGNFRHETLFTDRVSRRGDFFCHNGDFGEKNFGIVQGFLCVYLD